MNSRLAAEYLRDQCRKDFLDPAVREAVKHRDYLVGMLELWVWRQEYLQAYGADAAADRLQPHHLRSWGLSNGTPRSAIKTWAKSVASEVLALEIEQALELVIEPELRISGVASCNPEP